MNNRDTVPCEWPFYECPIKAKRRDSVIMPGGRKAYFCHEHHCFVGYDKEGRMFIEAFMYRVEIVDW